jgi:hypothetical protein
MSDDESIEQAWVVLVVCACPNCGFPSVQMSVPSYEPSESYFTRSELPVPTVRCQRCDGSYIPQASSGYRHVVPWPLKTNYQRRT